jgi:hypothetical protein
MRRGGVIRANPKGSKFTLLTLWRQPDRAPALSHPRVTLMVTSSPTSPGAPVKIGQKIDQKSEAGQISEGDLNKVCEQTE